MSQGSPFYEGGLREISLLDKAVSGEATEIVCVVCQTAGLQAKNFNRNNIFHLIGRELDIARNEIIQNDLNRIRRRNALLQKPQSSNVSSFTSNAFQISVKIIRPEDEIEVEIDDFDSQDIKNMIAAGEAAVRRVRMMRDVTKIAI